jgi:hypothetical protein
MAGRQVFRVEFSKIFILRLFYELFFYPPACHPPRWTGKAGVHGPFPLENDARHH